MSFNFSYLQSVLAAWTEFYRKLKASSNVDIGWNDFLLYCEIARSRAFSGGYTGKFSNCQLPAYRRNVLIIFFLPSRFTIQPLGLCFYSTIGHCLRRIKLGNTVRFGVRDRCISKHLITHTSMSNVYNKQRTSSKRSGSGILCIRSQRLCFTKALQNQEIRHMCKF